MVILLVQTDIEWLSPEANRLEAERMIDNAVWRSAISRGTLSNGASECGAVSCGAVEEEAPPDLIVLPEMFTTGFVTDPAVLAGMSAGMSLSMSVGMSSELSPAPTLEWMRRMAAKHNAALAGTVPVLDDGRFYNRMFFVRPDGSYTTYDKKHLFTFAGERAGYSPGAERVVVEWRGVRILLQTCYDLRFPVFSRNRGDYDMILYSANWPNSRIEAWRTLLRARAIENLCYVAGVNSHPSPKCRGCSAVINFKGGAVVESGAAAIVPAGEPCGSGEMQYGLAGTQCGSVEMRRARAEVFSTEVFHGEVFRAETFNAEVLRAEVDMAELTRFRERFPALDDADPFVLAQ